MAEVYVTKEAQQYSENIISQWLRDSGYDGSLEDGTSLYDTVIRPSSLIYTLFRQNIDKAYAYMSLAKANSLRGALSEEDYDSAIDGVLSNWFVSRNLGGQTKGSIRLYFSRPLDYIDFYDNTYIATYSGISFSTRIYDVYASEVKAFNADDFHSVMNTENNTSEFYIDVPVISNSNTDLTIYEGAVFSVQAPDIYFLRGVAAADFIPGKDRETSESFISRTKDVITTRELITRRAFNTVLFDQFSELRSLYVSGCGDPEMIRDIKNFPYASVVGGEPTTTYTPVHVGNKADLWVGSDLQRTYEVCTVKSDGNRQYIELENSPVHILQIEDNERENFVDPTVSSDVDEGHWQYAMDEIPGYDDTLEERWFIPGTPLGKIYVDLQPLQNEVYDTGTTLDEVIVVLSHNAIYGKVTEGNDITYKITLNTPLSMDVNVVLHDANVENSEQTITITAGSIESAPIVITTRENDVYATQNDTIELSILSTDLDGVVENITIVNPDPVIVTDEVGYIPEDYADENDTPVYVPDSVVRTVTVHEITSDVAKNIQEFIASDTNRVASFDPQVKMKIPVVMQFGEKDNTATDEDPVKLIISTNVAYSNPKSSNYDKQATDVLISDIKSAIKDYLNSTIVYVESEMVQSIHNAVPAVSVVHLPVPAKASFMNMKTGRNVHIDVSNRFSIDPSLIDQELSKQITMNTIQYYTNDDLINIELR